MTQAILIEADRLLAKHSPDDFDTTIDAYPECTAIVAAVEDHEAWKHGYPSLEAFYQRYEHRHPDIRLYGKAYRDQGPGTGSAVINRLRPQE